MSVIQSSPLPPSYSDPSADNILQESPQLSDLPAYTVGHRVAPARPTYQAVPKIFEYELKHKGKPLVFMTVIAEEAFSKNMPTFLENSPIKGRVKLTLDKPEAVQAVVVSACGQISTGPSPMEKLTFVEVLSTLWSPLMGNPRPSSVSDSATGPNSASSTAKFISKLEGEYAWDFSLDLPKEVIVTYGRRTEPQVFSLPQTFKERHTRVSVAYEVAVRIVRSKLRADHRLAASFGYIPIQRPGPFSALRSLAYEEGIPLLGPTIDPTGWYAQRQIRLEGKVNNRSGYVGCTLFLAKPLCYTKGSVIPLMLLLESEDNQALDLLSLPKSIVVRLRRLVKYHSSDELSAELPLAWRDAVEYSHLATWWPSTEASVDDPCFHLKRYINGELRLETDVKPTSAMAHFRLEYAVVMFPFDAVGYERESASKETLIEQPVEIATAFGLGPRPMMFAPPEYESHRPVEAQPFIR